MFHNDYYNPVSNFFRSKGIVIPPENQWMQGCIDFCLSENPNVNLNQVQSFVHDQWLLADLCDVGVPCLPPNLASRHSSILQGCFPLQVNEVMNVGQSAYTQLQKVRNAATKNAEVSDSKPTAQAWEPKGGRMLRLVTTDGIQKVLGMEYKPIKSLQEPFVPGFKIIVRGPIECRKGVMLLEEKHLTVCGGEVDDLVIQNSLENLLLKSLNLESMANPKNLIRRAETQTAATEERIEHCSRSQVPFVRNENAAARNPPTSQRLQAQAPVILSNNTNNQNNSQREARNNSPQTFQMNQEFFDGFLDDDDDDLLAMHLDQVDVEEHNAINSSEHLLSDEDEALLQISDNLLDQNTVSPPLRNASSVSRGDYLESNHTYSYNNGPSCSRFYGSNNQDHSISKTSQIGNVEPKKECDNLVGTIKSRQSMESEPLRNPHFQRIQSQQGDAPLNQLQSVKEIKKSRSQDECHMEPAGPSQTLRLPDLPFLKRSASSPLKNSQEKYPSEKVIKNSLFATATTSKSSSTVSSSLAPSFFELFHDLSVPRFVKAKVVSLTSKLKIKDRKWTLSAMISDGSEEMKMDFSPQVLEKLAQYSAADITNKKDEIEKDPVLKELIRNVLIKAKAKVSTLQGKMKIEFPNIQSNPVITEVIED